MNREQYKELKVRMERKWILGEPMYIIREIDSYEMKELPMEYLNAVPRAYMANGVLYVKDVYGKLVNYSIGEAISIQEAKRLYIVLNQAGTRLYGIMKRREKEEQEQKAQDFKKLVGTWTGEYTIKV